MTSVDAMQAVAFERLHPALRHHVVNTLGWAQLRPLQAAAIGPVGDGSHVLTVGPTAGGKTEAAMLPLLSRAATEDWRGLQILYICPLRALLNNLHPRLEQLCGFAGRRAGLWHGDIGSAPRAAIQREPPEILVTTPESLEAMLVSTKVAHRELFAGLRAVVIDEVHAFAGDDRGWHLLAVLSRLQHLAGRELQRVGLSATIGNPDVLLDWMTQGCRGALLVVAAGASGVGAGSPAEVVLDHVGSVANAATGHLPPAPGRETAGLRRQPGAGGAARRRPQGVGNDHVRLPQLALPGRAPARRGSLHHRPGLRHRGHLDAGARRRRR